MFPSGSLEASVNVTSRSAVERELRVGQLVRGLAAALGEVGSHFVGGQRALVEGDLVESPAKESLLGRSGHPASESAPARQYPA